MCSDDKIYISKVQMVANMEGLKNENLKNQWNQWIFFTRGVVAPGSRLLSAMVEPKQPNVVSDIPGPKSKNYS